MRHIILLSIVSFLVLCSCSRRGDEIITKGPVSATGTLINADVSLTRRGSHILTVDGVSKYFVESKTENLRDYEGRIVYIEGILEPNTTNDLPVIIVKTIASNVGNDDLHQWNIPVLNLLIATPKSWKGSIQGKTATFLLEGEELPLLTIRLMSGSSLPPGTSFYVKNRPAIRTEKREGSIQEVFLLERDTVINFIFDPSTQKSITTVDEAKILSAEFERMLSEVSFLTDTKHATKVSGTGSGVTCGGPAGILCGTGYYCAILSGSEGIGVCQSK